MQTLSVSAAHALMLACGAASSYLFMFIWEKMSCAHKKKTGRWQSRSCSKCPREDKQTSAPKEKKSLQLVGKRAQILTGGIIVREMRKVLREGGMKRKETGGEGIK